MESLYHQTNQLIQESSDLFQKLEREHNTNACEAIENEIQSRINSVSANCDKLDVYVFKTPINQRPMAKMRVDQLKYDNRHIHAALASAQARRRRREQEASEREQLLSRRFTAHDHTAITVDHLAQEQGSLQSSHRNVDEMLHTGSSILDTLRGNRGTLQGARRRMLDLANALGLSNATISLVERRAAQDRYVLGGGMLLTLAVIALVYVYLV